MRQVEVDEMAVQKKLGKINMDFVRKAEKRNKERASMHRLVLVTVMTIYSLLMFDSNFQGFSGVKTG